VTRAAHQFLSSTAHHPVLQSRAVGAFRGTPGTATAVLDFFENGVLRTSATGSGDTICSPDWGNGGLVASTNDFGALYEIRLTVTSGTSPSSGDLVNTWLSMSGGTDDKRSWSLSRSTLGTSLGEWLVEIRSALTQSVLDSASYFMSASVGSP
jgi:hypothetical protein